jgi:hypothetical protein
LAALGCLLRFRLCRLAVPSGLATAVGGFAGADVYVSTLIVAAFMADSAWAI